MMMKLWHMRCMWREMLMMQRVGWLGRSIKRYGCRHFCLQPFIFFIMRFMKWYGKDFMPQWRASWYCSLTVALGIMNYFFGTTFAAKDNFDLFGLIRWGRRQRGDLINESEMALFLDRLYLEVTSHLGITAEDAELYEQSDKEGKIAIVKKYTLPEFQHCIQWDKRVMDDGKTVDLIDELVEERLKSSGVKNVYNLTDEQIVQTIRAEQQIEKWGVLFLLWLNRHILYEEDIPSNDGWWHRVLSTGINDNNECIIYEPIFPRPNPHLIPIDRVIEALHGIGTYSFLIIKDNPLHRD